MAAKTGCDVFSCFFQPWHTNKVAAYMLLQWQHFQLHLFSMAGFLYVLEKPFCKANPLVGKPFCTCGKALLQGLFGMHGKKLLPLSQHTLLCCFGLLACRKQKFHQLLFCLCCPAGLAQGDSCNEPLVFTRARHMLQVALILPTTNCYGVSVDEHFLFHVLVHVCFTMDFYL